MKCEDLLRLLNDYVDGEIDPSVCEYFEGHLEECNPCKVVVDNIGKTIKLYQQEGKEVELPLKFRDRLHDSLREQWKKRGESCA